MLFHPLLVLPLLAQASPLQRRACAVEYPAFVSIVDSGNPNLVSNPIGNNPGSFATKDASGRVQDTFIQFNVPANSYGCQLELFFDKGYYWQYPYFNGPMKADVHTIDNPVPYNLTWNTAPAAGSLFGNTGELPKVPDSSAGIGYAEGFKRPINSAPCKSVMTYRMKVAPEVSVGGVQFYQYTPDRSYPQPWGGWRMTHNC